jgi:tetratricopeptide (TPR) repeat protein
MKLIITFCFIVLVTSLSAQTKSSDWFRFDNDTTFSPVISMLYNGETEQANEWLNSFEKQGLQNASDTVYYVYNILRGSMYYQQDNDEYAKTYFLNAKKVTEEKLGVLHPEYLSVMRFLAQCEVNTGNLDAAISLLQESIVKGEIFDKCADYGLNIGYLAELLIDKKQYSGVEDLLKQADAILNKILPKEDARTYDYRRQLAHLLMLKGEYEKSNKVLSEILPLMQLLDDEIHNANFSTMLFMKGANFFCLEKYDQAEQNFRETIKFDIEKYGDYAVLLGNVYNSLLKVYCKTGNEQKIDSLIPVIKDYHEYLKEDTAFYLSISDGANKLMEIQNYNKATELYKMLLPVVERMGGSESYGYGILCNYLTVSNIKAGNLDEATEFSDKALAQIEKEDWLYPTLLHNRGKILLDQRKFSEAVKFLSEAKELQKKQGNVNPKTQEYLTEAQNNLE